MDMAMAMGLAVTMLRKVEVTTACQITLPTPMLEIKRELLTLIPLSCWILQSRSMTGLTNQNQSPITPHDNISTSHQSRS